MTYLGVICPPDQPPERLRDVALAAEEAGLDELWLWEDCFKQSGIAPAAAALAWTSRIRVGIALMPVPLRNVALSAMEIATLARLFPGRFLPAVGHGVLDWMGQAGARVESPMTLLREYVQALQALLAGERVTSSGRYVTLDDVVLDWPPEQVPPLLLGANGPKTLALAGELADGLAIDAGHLPTALETVGAAWAAAARPGRPDVLVFQNAELGDTAEQIAERVRLRAAEGATRVAVVVVPQEGLPPEGGAALIDMVAVLGRARALLQE